MMPGASRLQKRMQIISKKVGFFFHAFSAKRTVSLQFERSLHSHYSAIQMHLLILCVTRAFFAISKVVLEKLDMIQV